MKEFTEQMIADRRFLHAHPEEGWCEFETTWYIVNRLQELVFSFVNSLMYPGFEIPLHRACAI